MKKLVIFDLDGTLLNTLADLAAATNHALKTMELPTHSEETICSFVGNGVPKLLERALPEHERTAENLLRMKQLFRTYYDAHQADRSRPYAGIEQLLNLLQEKGVLLAVASNKYQEATEKLVARFFPHITFCLVLGQRAGVPTKPDPSIVHSIIQTAGVKLEEVLYVGDSAVDMLTARNAGVEAVGVSWGFRKKAELETYHPQAVIDEAQDLWAYL